MKLRFDWVEWLLRVVLAVIFLIGAAFVATALGVMPEGVSFLFPVLDPVTFADKVMYVITGVIIMIATPLLYRR